MLLSFFYVLFSLTGFSQILPENGIVFDDTNVSMIRIYLEQDSLNELLAPENQSSDHEYPAQFIFINSSVNDTIENVGFRLRGNTSRASDKKSFKVGFNTFFSERNYYGHEKFNLNGEHNDPSIIRTKLSFDLYRNLNVPAPRVSHTELYVNDEYKGLYVNVEHIDEEFAELHFGNKNGNLYKCLWPADLNYINSNPDSYKLVAGDRRVYELKTNEELDDYADLENFINVLNNTPIENLHTELEPVFNVNSYLKSLAIEILVGHWDGYSYNKNNFYLYHNQLTDKFEFIPYDLDNTFGIDWFGIDWAIRNIYNWSHGSESRPLTERLLQNQVYKDRFTYFLEEILTKHFDPAIIFDKIDLIKSMITTSAENDMYRTLDYAWDIQDFHDSYIQSLGDHVSYGIKPYITARFNAANSQMIQNSIAPIISNINYTNLFAGRDLEVFAIVEDEDMNPDVVLHYQINSGVLTELSMTDDGSGNDLVAGDKVFSAFVTTPLSGPGIVEFYISAADVDLNTTLEPINGMYSIIIPEASDLELYINEIMASNNNTVADEFGEYDDWIEIFNGGTTTVWLGDKYLSDDHFTPSKWQMPDVEIHSGDFLLFWADENTQQGDFHTNFKLGTGGEEIGIYDSESTSYAEIDFFEFGAQATDVSFGRVPDGLGDLGILPYATPGFSNTSELSVNLINPSSLTVFPNPFNNEIFLSIEGEEYQTGLIRITDITGQTVSEQKINRREEIIQIQTTELKAKSGMYILSVLVEDAQKKVKHFENKLIVRN